MQPKLVRIWWLVCLRGLFDVTFAAPFFWPFLREVNTLTALVALTTLIGGLLELVMYWRMRGHTFQGVLRLIGAADVLLGTVLFFIAPVTLALLLVLTGLWIGVRSFAVLWLGLSIVAHPYLRLIPAGAGVLGIIGAGIAMLFLEDALWPFVLLLLAYAAVSVPLHLLIGLRMRREWPRVEKEEAQQAAEPSSAATPTMKDQEPA